MLMVLVVISGCGTKESSYNNKDENNRENNKINIKEEKLDVCSDYTMGELFGTYIDEATWIDDENDTYRVTGAVNYEDDYSDINVLIKKDKNKFIISSLELDKEKQTEEFTKEFINDMCDSLKNKSDDNNDLLKKKAQSVTKEKGKTNIYVFYSESCPHCEDFHEFLVELQDDNDYKNLFKVIDYEVNSDPDNLELYQVLSSKVGDSPSGIPYYIIGNKGYEGFSESSKDEVKKAIKEAAKKDYDILVDNAK